MRPNKADALALSKAHVLRFNTKIGPVFTANTKEAALDHLHKGGGRPSAAPPLWFPLWWAVYGCVHWPYFNVETQDMCLVESQDMCLVEKQDMCCVENWGMCFVQSQHKGRSPRPPPRRGRLSAAPLCGSLCIELVSPKPTKLHSQRATLHFKPNYAKTYGRTMPRLTFQTGLLEVGKSLCRL